MKQLQGQGLIKRYARQDDNKDRVEQFNKVLDEALQEFSVSFLDVELVICSYTLLKIIVISDNLAIECPPTPDSVSTCESGTTWRGSWCIADKWIGKGGARSQCLSPTGLLNVRARDPSSFLRKYFKWLRLVRHLIWFNPRHSAYTVADPRYLLTWGTNSSRISKDKIRQRGDQLGNRTMCPSRAGAPCI